MLLRKCTRCSVEGGGRIDGRGAAWGCAAPLLARDGAAYALGLRQLNFECMRRHANAEGGQPCDSSHACGPKLVGIVEASQVEHALHAGRMPQFNTTQAQGMPDM